MMYVGLPILSHLNEELAWITDKQLQILVRNIMLFKIVIPLRN